MLWTSEMISIMCKLNTLNWLEINANGLKLDQLESLVRRLSNSSTLRLNHTAATSGIYEDFTRTASICKRIPKLTIQTIDPDFSELSNDLLAHIADEIMLEIKMVVLKGHKDVIVIVKGEVQRNKIIVYKHDATDGDQPTTNFSDLNDTCLAKIIEFLKPKHHCVLYDTCQRTRKAVETFYSENVFCASHTSRGLAESVLWCLGKQIRSMKLSQFWYLARNEFEELWRRINLGIDGNILDHGDNFRHLTVLKFGYYNESVKKFLLALDDKLCEQMQELSIGSQPFMAKSYDENDYLHVEPSQVVVELVSIVSRFRKLTTLQLIVADVDKCNTKYLFENCTNLVDFGVWCKGEVLFELFDHIMDNCLHIGIIRLFGHGIYRSLLQKVRKMFSNVSVLAVVQDNVAFNATDVQVQVTPFFE
ncbi:uncharacterized protein LOC129573739 [Sitodiplosis mosellana]|uniref:uncharacterized protein LOC129573739 n=1 Tax=Sitodiplosis mosellana TaxID=263140 RepID=UPI0024451C5F|nr:uncharacterized protein LOC129573739 [Sitodiplosis mosellana]